MNPQPYSSKVLSLCGIILIGIGLYFVLLHPTLLPEDARFTGGSPREISVAVPGLINWLNKVFWVMGGYIFTAGLLTLYIAVTSFRTRAQGVAGVVAVAGLASIGWMSVVNFIIDSAYEWPLLGFTVLWGVALVLFWLEGRQTSSPPTPSRHGR